MVGKWNSSTISFSIFFRCFYRSFICNIAVFVWNCCMLHTSYTHTVTYVQTNFATTLACGCRGKYSTKLYTDKCLTGVASANTYTHLYIEKNICLFIYEFMCRFLIQLSAYPVWWACQALLGMQRSGLSGFTFLRLALRLYTYFYMYIQLYRYMYKICISCSLPLFFAMHSRALFSNSYFCHFLLIFFCVVVLFFYLFFVTFVLYFGCLRMLASFVYFLIYWIFFLLFFIY